jgi:hypothetical protein
MRTQESFLEALKGQTIADAMGPATGELIAGFDKRLARKTSRLYDFDPPMQRRYGYAHGGMHRLEAGDPALAGTYALSAPYGWTGTGEGNMLRIVYTWRQKPPRRAGGSRFWGVTLFGCDHEILFYPDDLMMDKLWLGTFELGGSVIRGRRFSRGAWWLGASSSLVEAQIDDFTNEHIDVLATLGVRAGIEYAVLRARSGPDVDEGLGGGPGGGKTHSDEGERHMGMSVFADVEWGDWGPSDTMYYMRYWRTAVGVRFYPSPYFGIGFGVPFSVFEVNGGELDTVRWEDAATFVRLSVLVQF